MSFPSRACSLSALGFWLMPFTAIGPDTTKVVFFPVCLEGFGVQNCLSRPEEWDIWSRVVGPVRLADLGAGLMVSAILNSWADAHTRVFLILLFMLRPGSWATV